MPKGYARAVVDVIGTRGSTGCWDYGGRAEQDSGIDAVKYLAHLPWSNGSVAMLGASYEGTTATMVAARGSEVPELKAIVPIASISRWYGYAYWGGVRYFLNSKVPTDEGIDTPLLFDAGFGRTVAADPTGSDFAPSIAARTGECAAVEHTAQGYSRNPDYGPFWTERDYRKDAAKFRAAVFLVHGWQDYNVKTEEALALYDALPVDKPGTTAVEGVPFKRMWLTQQSHADGEGPGYAEMLDAFLEQTLKGVDRGFAVGSVGAVSRGKTWVGAGDYRTEPDWPPPGTKATTLHLGRTFNAGPGPLAS
jgi:X-Pro dipeptidyl-peptidase